MNTAGNRSIDEIFSEALELADGQREQFIRQRCAGDADLERKIVSLLHASQSPDDELAQRFDTARDRLWHSVLGEKEDGEDLSSQRINAWRLVKRLARGGLATVYLAHREDGAFEQTAAFKVLRRGLDTDDLVARFRAERQMLSSLDHPSIAGILDGGALEDGRPYLVLEYVDGRPITDYCKSKNIDTRGCAELLIEVLRALHHAHKHLIVHRDIKPTNILVSTEGHVSLLDFGIAKLLDPAAMPGASTLTRTGVSLLTPGYGSPEQHAGQPVTTASDIHQVGQVMYELLTGKRPFDGPRKPMDQGQVLPSQALRGKPLFKKVRGDLDAIVGKAMHPDPTRRYASADEMVADLERYLDGRPVLARPDTLRYRLGKLGKRRPWLFPALAIAVIAVVVYIATLTQHAQQLQIEQRRAEAAQSFMVDLLRSADPFMPADPERGRDITVVEALDIGVERLDTDLHDDPELRATLLVSIASVYASLDQHERSIELREEALSLERDLYEAPSSEILGSLQALAILYRAINDYERAIEHYDEQLAMARTLYPEQHPAVGVAQTLAAEMEVALGNEAAARIMYEDGIQKMRTAPAENARPLINALVELARMQTGDSHADAMESLTEARRMATELHGVNSLSMALVHAQTATAYSVLGDYEASVKEFRASVDIYESKVGRDHSATLSALNNLGYLYMQAGQLDRAEILFDDLVERSERKFGSENREVANAYQNLAGTIGRQGRFAEAIPLHRKAFEIYKSVLLGDHFMQAYPLISIAYAELQLGDHAKAENTAREAHALLEAIAPGTYPAGVAQCLVGLALENQGRADEGAEIIRESHSILAVSAVFEPYRGACRVPDPGS